MEEKNKVVIELIVDQIARDYFIVANKKGDKIFMNLKKRSVKNE